MVMDGDGREYPVREAKGPCVAKWCGKPIQPGQLFVPGKRGPRHVGCDQPPRRRVETQR